MDGGMTYVADEGLASGQRIKSGLQTFGILSDCASSLEGKGSEGCVIEK
jgi:hypothetical protein